jgi:hypothetical protein
VASNRFVAINSGSTSTSSPWLCNDYAYITVSWQSSASLGPSRFTVEGSNADGLQASDLGGATSSTNWSLVTGVNIIGRPSGAESLDAGYRWFRTTVAPANHSAASATSIVFNGVTS